MFDIIIRYIQGFYRIKASGVNTNRFFNLCKSRGIIFWDINKSENEMIFFVGEKDYEKLNEPANKTSTDIDLLNKYGMKHFIKKNKKRFPFVIGFITFAILIYVQSLFIWNISVTGEEDYTADEILKHVKKTYVSVGTLKSDVSPEELEKNLRADFTDIAWISCSIEGTKLSIEITETLNVFTDTSMDVPCNIVAIKDCTISEIVTSKGVPVVKAGDDVKAGDILISGAIYLYDDNNEVLDTNYVPAEGEVYGICTYDYEYEISLKYYEKQYNENKRTYYSFGAFNYIFTPYVPSCDYENYDIITDVSNAHLGNSFYLPFSFEKTTISEYEPVEVSLNTTDAESKAEARHAEYISDLQEKGVQIIENNVKITFDDDTCYAKGTIVVSQLIGIPQELTVSYGDSKSTYEERNID